jgi:hypothetical protein
MLVLVTTTWNTSAADPKRAIARADALILAPKCSAKHPGRTDQTQSPKIRLSFVGVHGRRLPIWHLQTIALTAELDRRTFLSFIE